jgi:hypothetical protein
MTGRDLIGSSMRLIGALASGESPSAAEATDGLSALNSLLDSLSTEELMIPNKVREVFALTPAQAAYTMGTGGAFNTSRPQAIEEAALLFDTSEIPVKVIGKEEYASIVLKSVQSTIPAYVYPDGAYPLTTLTLWPVPSIAYSLVLYSWKPLSQVTLNGTVSLPPGGERMLKYLLAIEMSPEYGKALTPDLVALANEAKASFKRMNYRPRYLRTDDALTGQAGGWPSIFGGRP